MEAPSDGLLPSLSVVLTIHPMGCSYFFCEIESFVFVKHLRAIVDFAFSFSFICLKCSVPMKDEENLNAQEIKEEALLTIDGPDFHGCGREFKKELK